jgi:putative inorganic carbon (HCO3(-)) transporter
LWIFLLLRGIVRILLWIDRWHWVFLALAAPLLLFPSPSRSLAMLIVPGLWIVGLLARRDPLPRTPLNLSLLLLAAMVLVSLYATYDLAQSLSKIAGMVLAFGVFFACARQARRLVGWWGACLVLGATSVAIALVALVSVEWLSKVNFIAALTLRLPRWIASLPGAEQGVSPNELAGALVWGIPLFAALTIALFARRAELGEMIGGRKVWLALSVAGMVTLFMLAIMGLTQSRGGYLGCALAFALMLFVVASWRWRAVLVVSGIVVVIAAVFVLRSGNAVPLYDSALALSPESMLDTWEGRTEIWSRAIYGIEDFAFTGMGMNTFRRVVTVLYPLFLVSPEFDVSHAHNEFLQAALDLGVPGLIAFIALYLGAAMMLGTLWTRARATMADSFFVRAVVLGLAAGLFAHLVYGMTDAVTLGAKPGVLFWMLLGLLAGLYEQMQSGELSKWYEWFGAAVSRDLPPLANPEALGD